MTIDLQPGSSFDQYTLERRLGGGGFGDVWLAHDAAGARVALKVLHGQYQNEEATGLRAEIELLAANASARSSHIVRVLGGGSEPAPFVVMEYIEGRDLSQEIARRGALPLDEVLNIAEAIADALATLQRAGIIHRDIKPANVIIDAQGVIKLTDFGIAKIVGVDSATATGQISLSMAYAAPEVWDGKASQLSDHYAFGALLYQCLTGRPVFSGNYAEIYRHHLNTPPDLDGLPADTPFALRDMIADCLAKAPEQRPQNASLLLEAIATARREMSGDSGATMFVAQNVEPKRLGPWVIEGRSAEREWTFNCAHQTSGEKALLELHFSDDLAFMDVFRKAVDVNASLVPLGAERLIGTSRLVLRPGEAWQNAPNTEFEFWVAREATPPTTPQGSISATELQKITDTLNQFLAIARANNLQLDMRAENLALRSDGSVLVRRPGLPPFPAGDPTAAVIAFLESLPLDQATMMVTPAISAALETAVIAPAAAAASPARPAPIAASTAPVPRKSGGGSKTPLLAGVGVAAIAAVAVGAFLILGNGSHKNTKGPASAANPSTTSDTSTAPYATTPAANSTTSSVAPASATFVAQGLAAGTAKDYATANADYTKAIDADPKNAEAYFRRGLSFINLNKPDQALPDFNKAIELSPTTVNYYLARGDLEKTQKKTDAAMADYTKAIALDPQNSSAYFDRGTLYSDLDNYDAGIADLTKAIELNPKSAISYNNRGVIYRNSGKSDLAIADFTKAIELDPKYVLPVANRARLYYDLKRYDESLVDSSKSIDLDPSSAHYVSRGLVYSALIKYDLAAADYTKATQVDPKNALAFYNLSAADANQKLYDDAITNATKAIAIDSSYYLAYYGRGLDYKAENKTDLARADFEKAKTLAKTTDDSQRAQSQLDQLK